MADASVLYEVGERIAVLTVNRPDRLNALDHRTMREIATAVEAFRQDPAAGVMIVTGSGPKAFVAGADISELSAQDPIGGQRMSLDGQAVLAAIDSSPKPVIAAINGFALGGGLELALACHLRVASENAVLGLPEVSLGIIPGYGGTQRLTRLIGRGRATEMILTGKRVTAAEALEMGLLTRVVPVGQVVEAARVLATQILANGPLAVSLALAAIREGSDMPLAEATAHEASLFGLAASSADMKEGLRAFLEKRRPGFTGR